MLKKIGPAIRESKLTKMRVLIVIVLVLAGTGVTTFMGKTEKTIEAAPNKVSVKVSEAKNVIKNSTLSYKASLEASQEGIVSGKVGGNVVQVMFENGHYVSQGDTLIKLDDQDIKNHIASSEAKLKASESQVTSSESQLVSSQTGLQKMQLSVDNAVRIYDRTKELSGLSTMQVWTF